MRIEFLKGLDYFDAYNIIEEECWSVLFKDVVSNPKDMAGKAVVFRTGCVNGKLLVRIFKYIVEENLWTVADVNTHDGARTSFEAHYNDEYIKLMFWKFYNARGFIVDADEDA